MLRQELSIEQTMEFINIQMSYMDETHTHSLPPATLEDDEYFSKHPRKYFGYLCQDYLSKNIEKLRKEDLLGQDKSLSKVAEEILNAVINKSNNGIVFALMLLTITKNVGMLITEGKCKLTKNPEDFYKLVAKSLHEKAHLLTRGYNCWEQALVATKMPFLNALKKAQNDERKLSCTKKAIQYGLAAGVILFTGFKILNTVTPEKTPWLKM